jgi:acyl carrier protein
MTATADRADIIAKLSDILDRVTTGRIKATQVSEDASIFDNLGLSSLELLELRWEIESTWNIQLDDQDIAHLKVVADVINLIADRTAPKAGA